MYKNEAPLIEYVQQIWSNVYESRGCCFFTAYTELVNWNRQHAFLCDLFMCDNHTATSQADIMVLYVFQLYCVYILLNTHVHSFNNSCLRHSHNEGVTGKCADSILHLIFWKNYAQFSHLIKITFKYSIM
jgi:hypothetical protein